GSRRTRPRAAAGDARAGVFRPHRVGRGRAARAGATTGARGLMPTFLTAYRWEMRKLWSQKRTYLGLGAAVAVPIIFVTALALQSGSPNDVAFGKYVRESGLAIPLVLLLFASVWLFPLVTALVAGDIIASEHHNGTLKTIFTRSLDRGQIFTRKVLTAFTYAIVALFVMGTTAVVAGTIKSGFNPLVTLSGTKVSASKAL